VRRSLLVSLSGLGLSLAIPQTILEAQTAALQGYVLNPNQGEHLIQFRDHGNIHIKAGSVAGSDNLAFGTQQVMRATGIPVYRHLEMDGAFYVLEGSGEATLNDVPQTFEKGSSIFIPRNTWHGFNNPEHELLLLWIVTPAGLDGFLRETCTPRACRQSSSPATR
jgi:quercetin dioxygenase-like cupin family protein